MSVAVVLGGGGPHLCLDLLGVYPTATEGQARLEWSIENLGPQRAELIGAWLPNSRFRSEPERFSPGLTLWPGARQLLGLVARSSEPPGTEIENAFLILTVLAGEVVWKVFVRLRVLLVRHGPPQVVVERTTWSASG